jgi:hypothetical protein
VGPRGVAALTGLGRIALGAAILAAPEPITGRWLGEGAGDPLVIDLARGMAARDIALGVATLLTLDDNRRAARMQLACAGVDATDAAATVLARRALPLEGVAITAVMAGAASVVSLAVARALAAAD